MNNLLNWIGSTRQLLRWKIILPHLHSQKEPSLVSFGFPFTAHAPSAMEVHITSQRQEPRFLSGLRLQLIPR